MTNELINETISLLEKFENTGDWYYFSLALDALSDLQTEIERENND